MKSYLTFFFIYTATVSAATLKARVDQGCPPGKAPFCCPDYRLSNFSCGRGMNICRSLHLFHPSP